MDTARPLLAATQTAVLLLTELGSHCRVVVFSSSIMPVLLVQHALRAFDGEVRACKADSSSLAALNISARALRWGSCAELWTHAAPLPLIAHHKRSPRCSGAPHTLPSRELDSTTVAEHAAARPPAAAAKASQVLGSAVLLPFARWGGCSSCWKGVG